MFWRKKKNKRLNLELRASKKRKSFFERKEDVLSNDAFSKIIFRFIFLLFAVSLAYILFLSPFLEIRKVYLEGTIELNREDVNNKINEVLAKKTLNLISRNNFILFPYSKIKSELLGGFKKISNVKIEKIFPDSIKVKITERKSLLIWCSAGPCFIIDENGYAYTGADFESEEIKQNNLLSIIDNSGKPVIMGEKILNDNYIKFAISLKDELDRETGIKVNSEYHTGSKMADEVKVKTEEGWEIYFSAVLPIEDSVRTLKTFLDKEIDQGERSKLEYVDLRAENRAYYKFKDEESQNSTEAQQPAQQDGENEDNKKKE
ncbi:MAG: FtsQ-type POTRA domain-containing protein [Parcubacteria group bacterium]|jgi:cell division septal protein FtsQ